ncbi:putative quorum-sensing-regulated virulence factor [Chitinophaga rhizosphaerae]|uniref:putative quorum-sensing-regulated virulence factor n=1 Tax=Chitinophaga rhizosphaerae TaxID=1864947 RepID=UPI000F804DDF|nr:DUF3820 family protein [Chitinophaga rhizosphaerae]
MQNAFTDRDLMPFGKHRGKAMANVPAPYLLYLLNAGIDHPGVKGYILDNLDILNKEAAKVKR